MPKSNIEAVLNCPDGIVRDKFWIWGHAAGSHDAPRYGLSKTSRMTPAEGALYLGVPNILLIRYQGKPAVAAFDQEAIALSPFKRVVWTFTGAGGATDAEEREATRQLLGRYSNFAGVVLDDYFHTEKRVDGKLVPVGPGEKIGVFGTDELKQLKAKFPRVDFYVTLYTSQLDAPIRDQLELMDVIMLWTWKGTELDKMEANLEKLEKLVPAKRKVLGCYMWNYGEKKPLPVPLMKHQCQLGLEWLKKGRIKGMIFLSNNICDMDLETVEWTRRWIQQVGDERI